MSRPYYGTCLVNGDHPEGSALARECPLRNAARRSERSRKAAATRWSRRSEAPKHAPRIRTLPESSGDAESPVTQGSPRKTDPGASTEEAPNGA